MSERQFLLALEKTRTRFKWSLHGTRGNIRLEGNSCACPIIVVYVAASDGHWTTSFEKAARFLGLNRKLARSIAMAADDWKCEKRLRRKILAAVGIPAKDSRP